MEPGNQFNLNVAVDKWLELNCQSDEFLPEDVLEIKSDLLTSVDEIAKEYNCSKQKALQIACERMGDRFDWDGEMKQVNEDNFQLKKVVLLFGGVIFYIFSYHFILCLNRIILIVSNYLNGDISQNVANASTFFRIVYFFSVTGMVAIYFWHRPVKWLFRKVTASTALNIFIVIMTFLMVILELYLMPKIRQSVIDRNYTTFFFQGEVTFRYIYFGIILVGYFLLFIKYNKKHNMYM